MFSDADFTLILLIWNQQQFGNAIWMFELMDRGTAGCDSWPAMATRLLATIGHAPHCPEGSEMQAPERSFD